MWRRSRRRARLCPGAIVAVAILVPCGPSVAQIHNAGDFEVWPFPADLNRDLQVDVVDLLGILAGWGACAQPCPPACAGDTNGDCSVDVVDLLTLLASWGPVDLTGTPYGLALVYVDGPIDWDTWDGSEGPNVEPVQVLLADLGVYDEQGKQIGTDAGVLKGKYSQPELISVDEDYPELGWETVAEFTNANNSFSVDPFGSAEVDQREAIIWSSEAHVYHSVDDYRREFLTNGFLESLNLPAQSLQNIKNLQYNPAFPSTGQHLPKLVTHERVYPGGVLLIPPFNNMNVKLRTRGPYLDYASLPPLSLAFDPELVIGEYAGLAANWITAANQSFPDESILQGNGWTTNVLPVINDGLNDWVGHRVTNNTEVFKYASSCYRFWNDSSCGGTWIPCGKGRNIRNVMMFDEADLSQNGVFPYSVPLGVTLFDGPNGGDLAGLFVSAVFYDIAYEVGLGAYKTDQLFWKTISLIDNMQTFTMRTFGAKIQLAARMLWPQPGNPNLSIYEDDLVDVLTSRGIPMNGVANFRDLLPSAIGPTIVPSANNFGSAHPENHPLVDGYTSPPVVAINGYIYPGSADYVVYRSYKNSKYGPCDKLMLTDGTFSPGGVYNGDGTFLWEAQDRELGNNLLLAPGTTIHWVRFKDRCNTESEGFYAEDVKPFGFRVVQATPNGFTFTVQRMGETEDRITYELTVVDPSLKLIGPATYDWTFTEFDGTQATAGGPTAMYAALRDQPFTISIDRTRDAQVDNLTLRERGNDLDRPGPDGQPGTAFVFDAVSGP